MIRTAAVLLQAHGVAGVTVDAVLERSGAPRGSVYHHFPGGRGQLLEEATAYAARFGEAQFAAAVDAGDPVRAVRMVCDGWIEQLERTGFRNGCPLVAVATESDERLSGPADIARRAFDSWRSTYARLLRRRGVSRARSERLAATVVAAVEGAVVLARAEGDAAPLRSVATELGVLVGDALPDT
jgi:AcrR family transcriptional regulator